MGQLINHNVESSASMFNPLQCCRRRCGSQPSSLFATFAEDVDERIKRLVLDAENEDDEADTHRTFAQRAESYFHKRPQLLSLLQDLYKAYLSLATNNRYCIHHRNHSLCSSSKDRQLCPASSSDTGQESGSGSSSSSSNSNSYISSHAAQQQNRLDYNSSDHDDAQSTIFHHMYQLPTTQSLENISTDQTIINSIIVELVIKNVEYEIVIHELGSMKESHFSSGDSSSSWSSFSSSPSRRKIALQKSLLEVLESERVILANEKARLEYDVAGLMRLNRALASEAMFLKHEAEGELAHYAQKLRDRDLTVRRLSHQIQNLQSRIFMLETENNYFRQQMSKKRDGYKKMSVFSSQCNKTQVPAGRNDLTGVLLEEACFQEKKQGTSMTRMNRVSGGGGGSSTHLGKNYNTKRRVYVKKCNFFLCGTHS